MNWSIEKKIFGGFGLAVALLVMMVFFAYQNIRQLIENNRWVAHTHEVLTELGDTLSMMKDIETGVRGYLITEDERYLEPYGEASTRVRAQLERVRSLTADNPIQQRRLALVEPLIAAELAFISETIQVA